VSETEAEVADGHVHDWIVSWFSPQPQADEELQEPYAVEVCSSGECGHRRTRPMTDMELVGHSVNAAEPTVIDTTTATGTPLSELDEEVTTSE
jgi:hypothetical protein